MFKLNLLTPEKKVVVDQEITEAVIPTISGEVDILPGHVPMIANLGTGILKFKVKDTGAIFKAVISSGYCEVNPEGVNILTESIQLKEEISEEKAKAQVAEANAKLTKESLTDAQFEETLTDAKKAQVGIDLVNENIRHH
ncbi:ATP synthase F1 subunit epsilon [Bdellovibrio sp. qaytius]|nr:ATP synthase F1 subunit epsilon [Bdellovibrio sp. qaytius]